jgi:peptide-methionine (S)-S-oxide reductase
MKLSRATFGNGCFWCTEAVFQRLQGVEKVKSGYSGGTIENPSYREVCSGTTGHAEVLDIHFDADVITYNELLDVFWNTHDPTTLNRQGNDVGTQYRSVIFYHSVEQKAMAEQSMQRWDASGQWSDPIVTEISPFEHFYPAEDYHDNYLELHGHEPYCAFVVRPKVDKFEKQFKEKLKNEGGMKA